MDRFQTARETHRIEFFNRKEFFDGVKTVVQHQCASCKSWYDANQMLLTEWAFGPIAVIECTNCA